MKHNFSQIPKAEIQRSSFDRSHGFKTTFDSGYLVPIFIDEVLPGDTFNLNMTSFSRLATPVVPFMDNLFQDTFFFFVPNRLVWENWQRFNGEQDNPGDSTDYLVPTIKGNFDVQSIGDYFGIPTGVDNIEVNALPFRAYNLIWNEWFRDENLQDSVPVPKGDTDSFDNYTLLRRGKRHDYFTSCLPWPQKGPGVDLPLSGNAPIGGTAHTEPAPTFFTTRPVSPSYYESDFHHYYFAGLPTSSSSHLAEGDSDMVAALGIAPAATAAGNNIPYPDHAYLLQSARADVDVDGLYADLSSIGAVSINSLRQAFQLQRLYERDARGGSRYTEIIRSHFGVISPDARLQRPEFLGGSSTPININPIAQTSSSDTVTPQGNLAAIGVGGDHFHGFTKSFTEHGYIIGLVNVRADLTYQQGLDRLWSRQTRFDFYWPVLAHLGEQAVLNKEIYAQGTATDDEVFGYQERFAEYRYKPTHVTGKFRSTYAQSLDVWHLSQKFDNLPTLSADFIEDKPPIERVVAVTDEPQFLLDVYFKLNCVRPMPVYSVPGLVDHF